MIREVLLEELRAQIKNDDVVLVVGTGISIAASGNACTASWGGLIEDGIERCVILNKMDFNHARNLKQELVLADVTGLLKIADEVKEVLKSCGEYSKWLLSAIGDLSLKDEEIVKALLEFNNMIITTNYDNLIEKSKSGIDAITWKDRDSIKAMINEHNQCILHIHGYYTRPDTVILSSQDYNEIQNDEYIREFLKSIALTKTFLFVGCGNGMEDPNFGELLKWIERVLKDLPGRHYMLAREAECNMLIDRNLAGGKIHALSYGSNYSDLIPFLKLLITDQDPLPPLPEPMIKQLKSRDAVLIEPARNSLIGWPLGLVSLAASAYNRSNIKVTVVDLAVSQYDKEQLADCIQNEESIKVIGIRATTPTLADAVRLAKTIKEKKRDDQRIVIGGPHITSRFYSYREGDIPDTLLYDFADILIAGEGERKFLKLMDDIENGSPLKFYNEHECVPVNRWEFTFDTYKSIANYIPSPLNYPGSLLPKDEPVASIMTSRGCNGKCFYCSASILMKKVLRREPDNIIKEIDWYNKYYGISRFSIEDDWFTHDYTYVRNVCDKLLDYSRKNNKKIRWSCITRPSTLINSDFIVPFDILVEMRKAGCTELFMGVETTNDELLKLMGRGKENLQTVDNAVSRAVSLGLNVVLSVQQGLPGSTEDMDNKTIGDIKIVVKKYSPNVRVMLSVSSPYPSTKFMDTYTAVTGITESEIERRIIQQASENHRPESRLFHYMVDTPPLCCYEEGQLDNNRVIKFNNNVEENIKRLGSAFIQPYQPWVGSWQKTQAFNDAITDFMTSFSKGNKQMAGIKVFLTNFNSHVSRRELMGAYRQTHVALYLDLINVQGNEKNVWGFPNECLPSIRDFMGRIASNPKWWGTGTIRDKEIFNLMPQNILWYSVIDTEMGTTVLVIYENRSDNNTINYQQFIEYDEAFAKVKHLYETSLGLALKYENAPKSLQINNDKILGFGDNLYNAARNYTNLHIKGVNFEKLISFLGNTTDELSEAIENLETTINTVLGLYSDKVVSFIAPNPALLLSTLLRDNDDYLRAIDSFKQRFHYALHYFFSHKGRSAGKEFHQWEWYLPQGMKGSLAENIMNSQATFEVYDWAHDRRFLHTDLQTKIDTHLLPGLEKQCFAPHQILHTVREGTTGKPIGLIFVPFRGTNEQVPARIKQIIREHEPFIYLAYINSANRMKRDLRLLGISDGICDNIVCELWKEMNIPDNVLQSISSDKLTLSDKIEDDLCKILKYINPSTDPIKAFNEVTINYSENYKSISRVLGLLLINWCKNPKKICSFFSIDTEFEFIRWASDIGLVGNDIDITIEQVQDWCQNPEIYEIPKELYIRYGDVAIMEWKVFCRMVYSQWKSQFTR